MRNITFSVIIPTLNEEKYLPRLLKSLSLQRYKNFEVIVVDGKSNDKTATIAQSFFAHVPKLTVINDAPRNVSTQRNQGAKIATGDYLVFFDADVQVGRLFLQGISHAIETHKSLLLTTWLKPDTDYYRDQVMVAVANVAMVAALFVDQQFVGGYDIILHKDLFKQMGGFNPKMAMTEDFDLVQRCGKAGVKLRVLRRPRLTMSLRRFRKFGYFAILRLYAQSWVYVLLKKPITKALVDYPMGGHLYASGKKAGGTLVQLEHFLMGQIKKLL